MPSKKGGYKIVSLGGLDLVGENLSLKGLYNALKLSYGKVILLCGIIINSVAMKDAYVQAEEKDGDIIIKHLYGYNLSVDNEDAITVEADSENVVLPIPAPEDDGSIVGVNVEGKYVLKPYPLPDVTALDNGKVLEVIAGSWGKGGKKVNVIKKSENSFTDEEYELIGEGAFIEGTIDGLKNPILFPYGNDITGNSKAGLFIAGNVGSGIAGVYTIGTSGTHSVTVLKTLINIYRPTNKYAIENISSLNGYGIPEKPSDTGTFTLKSVNGVLTWVQDQA